MLRVVYDQKDTDFLPILCRCVVPLGRTQQDLLRPSLSEMAPPEASQVLGEDEEAAAAAWDEEGGLQSDKVRGCDRYEIFSNIGLFSWRFCLAARLNGATCTRASFSSNIARNN